MTAQMQEMIAQTVASAMSGIREGLKAETQRIVAQALFSVEKRMAEMAEEIKDVQAKVDVWNHEWRSFLKEKAKEDAFDEADNDFLNKKI